MFNYQPISTITINTYGKCFPTSKFQVQNPKQVSKQKLANYKLLISTIAKNKPKHKNTA